MASDIVMALTVKEISPYSRNTHSASSGLRKLVDTKAVKEKIQIHNGKAPFSIIIYNTGLFPTGSMGDTDRDTVVAEFVRRLKTERPDVVCLSEVWLEDEKAKIRKELIDLYPKDYYLQGPDEEDLELQDGGLLLLSKYPIISSGFHIYRDCNGEDCAVNKGVLYARVKPPESATPWNIFFTHTQNDTSEFGRDESDLKALYGQLTRLGEFIQSKTKDDGFTAPTLVVGDFNINAVKKDRYDQMFTNLGTPTAIDVWATKCPGEPGFTHKNGVRIDYILLRAGYSLIPFPRKIDVIKWTAGGKSISDHYGVQAWFDEGLAITRETVP